MKILIWDIETAPALAYTWSLWPKSIPHSHVVKDWSILCAAWKWYGKRRVYHSKVDLKHYEEDYKVVVDLRDALMEADVLVHHNGDKFDLKRFNTRCLAHNLEPVPKITTIDTLKVVKKEFGFTSNRLDFIGHYLLGEGKLETPTNLWMKVLTGDKKSFKIMVDYNKQDVILLEDVYNILLPYIKNHPNHNLYTDSHVCPNCGSSDLQKRGYYTTRTTKNKGFSAITAVHGLAVESRSLQ